MIIWVLVKLPLILVALVGAIRIWYLRTQFDVIEAECIRCVKGDDDSTDYLATYRFVSCQNNIIEDVERTICLNRPVDTEKTQKLLSRKIMPQDVQVYEKVYSAIAWTIVPLMIVVLL